MPDFSQKIIRLKPKISSELQNHITRWVIAQGEISVPESTDLEPFWIGGGFTQCLTPPSDILNQSETQRYNYLKRASYELEWEWLETPFTNEIRSLINELGEFVKRITRIAVILQIPGKEVPAHRDLFIGNEYPNMREPYQTYWGEKQLIYQGDPWYIEKFGETPRRDHHRKQSYYGLRIPLSEKPNDNGKPFLQIPGQEKYYYHTGKNIFLLDEATCEHGADSVDFNRGVIIVDGELDLNFLEEYSIDRP